MWKIISFLVFILIKCVIQVEDIKHVGFDNGMEFKTNVDHSKWAVARDTGWTCIGDLNRDVYFQVH